MRIALIITFLVICLCGQAQIIKPDELSASYFGEMITHPGLKLGLKYNLKKWEKTRTHQDAVRTVTKCYVFTPAVGFFFHKRYQTGLFFIPEISFRRQNPKGKFLEPGIGLGYLRTFIPNAYEVNSQGDVAKTMAGHNYFASNFFIAFGKDLSVNKNIPISYFIKPQVLYAIPNFPIGTGYFAIELGLTRKLN